jgi:hypothetical protein
VGDHHWRERLRQGRVPRRDATAQRANANQAAATGLATVITLANELHAALVEKGVIKGGA